MLLVQIFVALVRAVITANVALVLFFLNMILKVVTLPVLIVGNGAYAKLNFFIYSKSLELLGFLFYGKNHMK
jgi:hypothetical protein